MLIALISWIITGSIFGFATNAIIKNKGYRENWFWWGFFFGFIAMLVAMSKPDMPRTTGDSGNYFGKDDSPLVKDHVFGYERKLSEVAGGWRCQRCGQLNAGYVGTCGCGCDKSGNMPIKGSEQTQQDVQTTQPQILFCTSCGKKMEADSKFCRYCGAKADNE